MKPIVLLALLAVTVQVAGEKNCAALARSLGFPALKEPITRGQEAGMRKLSWGKAACTYDPAGKVRSIVNFAEASVKSGEAKIRSAAAAIEVAKAKLSGTGFTLREPTEVFPATPWPASEVRVQIASGRSAFGYSTHGFAGGVSLMLNRYTAKVIALAWSDEYIPDKPNIRQKAEDAVRIAMPLFAKVKEPGRAYTTNALLQYYRPSKSKATAAGLKTLEQKRLRLCWVVTLAHGAKLTEMSAPVASVAVDAETGVALANP